MEHLKKNAIRFFKNIERKTLFFVSNGDGFILKNMYMIKYIYFRNMLFYKYMMILNHHKMTNTPI